MRVGTIIDLPNEYTRFGRIKDDYGVAYTVDPGQIPSGATEGSKCAYKVEIWENDSGLAYDLKED